MPETIKVHFPDIAGDVSPYRAWVRDNASGALLNAGGSVITEAAGTGLWSFSTPDRTICTDYRVRIYSGSTETAANLVFDGLLTANSTVVDTPFGATQHVVRGVVGNAVAATTTTLTPSVLAPIAVAASQFVGRVMVFDNDTTTTQLRGQATIITANTAAALPLFTVQPLTVAPVSTDVFSIL